MPGENNIYMFCVSAVNVLFHIQIQLSVILAISKTKMLVHAYLAPEGEQNNLWAHTTYYYL